MENTLLYYYMSNRLKTFKNSIIFGRRETDIVPCPA